MGRGTFLGVRHSLTARGRAPRSPILRFPSVLLLTQNYQIDVVTHVGGASFKVVSHTSPQGGGVPALPNF